MTRKPKRLPFMVMEAIKQFCISFSNVISAVFFSDCSIYFVLPCIALSQFNIWLNPSLVFLIWVFIQFSSSVVSDSLRPHESQASLFITISRSSLRLTSIESVMPSSHLNLGRPLLLLPPIPPSIRVFSNESTLCMRWPKYWSFSFSITPSKEIPGLISFRMDWLDLLAVHGTLCSVIEIML